MQELSMQWMMLLLILAYIIYDFVDIIGTNGYYAIGFIALLVGLLFYKMTQNFVVVDVKIIQELTYGKSIHRNLLYTVLVNGIMLLATLSHFYLRIEANKELDSLYYEYGLGGIIAIALQLLIKRNPLLGVSHLGIIVGSKFDFKLIPWKQIQVITQTDNHFSIHFGATFPIKKIELVKTSKSLDLKKIIERNITKTTE
jgi:hypothetical protein